LAVSPFISLGCLRAAPQTIDETTEKQARLMSVVTNGPRRRFEDDGHFFRPQLENVAENECRASEIVDRFESVPQRRGDVDSSRWRLFHRGPPAVTRDEPALAVECGQQRAELIGCALPVVSAACDTPRRSWSQSSRARC